jgi:SAM-dependent methyltransferase
VRTTRRRTSTAKWYRGGYPINRGIDRFIELELRARLAKGHLVVDVGCGNQPFRGTVARLGGCYVGIDRQVDEVVERTAVMDATSLGIAPCSADVVLCTELLEHAVDPGSVFAEFARVLRRDGIVLITTPFGFGLHEEPHDYQRLTPHGILRYASANGLHAEVLLRLGSEWDVMASAWETYWNRVIRSRRAAALAALLLLRTTANLVARLAAIPALGEPGPKTYLTNAAVLRKID